MARLIVQPARRPLAGSVPVPCDKSISHRALICAALAAGRSELRGFSYGEDNVATLRAFSAMGVRIEDDAHGTLQVHGVGLMGLREPDAEIDCGNSGTSMRLLAGVLAAQRFRSRLIGDASLTRRPMGRIVKPLRERGAVISGAPHPTRADDITAPLELGPLAMERLLPFEYQLPVASAQVKSALLLSGLWASGPTLVREPLVSRDHTERILDSLGIPIETAGPLVRLHPPASADAIRAFSVDLPGDLSAAAFPLVAGLVVPQSRVTTRGTGTNPTRTGILDIVRRLGGSVVVTPRGESLGEPFGELTATASSGLRGASVGGELALRAIDEIPIVAALAARASGVTEISDVSELRVKESDRIAAIVELCRAFGVAAEERESGLVVEGQADRPLKAAHVSSHGDHRIAMTAAVLALVADGASRIDDVDCIATSFPRFVGTLRALGAEIEVES